MPCRGCASAIDVYKRQHAPCAARKKPSLYSTGPSSSSAMPRSRWPASPVTCWKKVRALPSSSECPWGSSMSSSPRPSLPAAPSPRLPLRGGAAGAPLRSPRCTPSWRAPDSENDRKTPLRKVFRPPPSRNVCFPALRRKGSGCLAAFRAFCPGSTPGNGLARKRQRNPVSYTHLSPVSRTRRSFACMGSGSSPISSKKMVPVSAISNLPFTPPTLAPVNAPVS